jgi:ribosome biogenesis GTPase A
LAVDNNESLMFDQWLTKIHDKYDNEHLNHFEHNLEVWRELWRVTERATHVVVVADVRNPLLHVPASVYDLVTKELQKPMIVVLNKVDLIPSAVVQLWKRFLAGRFPLAQLVCFSSRSNAVHGDNDVSTRRRVLSKKLEVGDSSAIKGAVDILVACGIEPTEAQKLAEELNANLSEQESVEAQFEAMQEKKSKGGKRRSKRKQKKRAGRLEATAEDGSPAVHECQHCGCDDAVIACMSCATGGRPSKADANVKDEADAIARGYLLCARCDREEHAELKGHFHVRLQSAVAAESTDPAVPGSIGAIGQANTPKVTIGLIGHPNVGKSSVLNALAGKKIVSVSHTPGHTKRLQTILIAPEICICDCPGLVFPFAGVPKYLQELSGLYPYSQIREPYSAVRFLADHVVLERILDLKPRTQLFDGIEEELVRGQVSCVPLLVALTPSLFLFRNGRRGPCARRTQRSEGTARIVEAGRTTSAPGRSWYETRWTASCPCSSFRLTTRARTSRPVVSPSTARRRKLRSRRTRRKTVTLVLITRRRKAPKRKRRRTEGRSSSRRRSTRSASWTRTQVTKTATRTKRAACAFPTT